MPTPPPSAPRRRSLQHARPRAAGTVLRWLGAAALAAAATCQAAGLTIGTLGTTSALPIHVAQAQGFFAAEGVAVQLKRCSSGPRCMDDLFDHSAQLVAVSELPVVMWSFKRADFAVVATIGTINNNVRLTARRSAGIASPEQLAGKRIGVMAGTSAQYYLDVYLHFHGVDPQQTRMVPLLPDAVPAAIVNRQVDALAAFNRQTRQALAALGDDGIVLPNPRIHTDTYNLVADRPTLLQRRDEIARVLRALQRANDFIARNPQQAKRILMSQAQMDPATAEEVFPTLTYRLSLDQSLVSTMENVARWARRSGHVAAASSIPDYRGFIDTAPLMLAVPDALPK